MKQSLLQTSSLVALPIFIVFRAQIDYVLTRDVGRTTRRRKHLALHCGFNFTGDLYQKLLPDSPRLRMFVCCFKQILASLAVYPLSNRFNQAQATTLRSIKLHKSLVDPPAV